MTKRQRAYQAYLRTNHWKQLRSDVFARDGNQCVICKSTDRIQAHHRVYCARFEDTLIEDLETLCRKHHRLTHGFGPTDFEAKAREIVRMFGHQKRPPVKDWIELKTLMAGDDDIMDFGDVMFQYIQMIVSHEREQRPNWWMDKERNRFWFTRAFNVRNSIWERIS